MIVGNKLFNNLVRPRAQIQFHGKGRIIYHVQEQIILPRLAEREQSHNLCNIFGVFGCLFMRHFRSILAPVFVFQWDCY